MKNNYLFDCMYLKIAFQVSKLSYCKRKQVGAILVKNNKIISNGYNSNPLNYENICEDEFGYTKWYTLHAESNAILKCATSHKSCKNAILYITLSPCKECSKLILQAKIMRLVYCIQYSDISGLEFLKNNGIEIFSISLIELYNNLII